ncbi:M23 family metallopeptidase [Paenibacillus lentus]|uniref:M23 family metallopeptidase n=1 Tax=Paenibacillus lentus TaxID=1338368 RepID=A0A3Q8SB47_9BACL|nr:M23 family metallopeptidase [Paenibacillus lentus]AZK46500.1 M23 family metallopeptidase [Paenibacillus lentus]
MDVKSNVKRRREERIKQLVSGEGVSAAASLLAKRNSNEAVDLKHIIGEQPGDEREQDPEWMWKHGQGRWKDSDLFGNVPPLPPNEGNRSSFWSMLFIRLSLSMLLFAGLWAIYRYEPPWSGEIRLFVAHSLTHEMDFGAAEAWYKRNFGGAPTFIPIFRQTEEHGIKVSHSGSFTVPLEGKIADAFAISLKGINILPLGDSPADLQVKSVETGRVLNVSNDAFTGQTITIQHASGYVSIYGHLQQAFVEKGDWVESGDLVGRLEALSEQEPVLYFALKKDDRYIDPADVIPFD